tara:strand:- start:6180 stop:6713 length:534 start_codon:yes stop_codon:yes gene_type:complete
MIKVKNRSDQLWLNIIYFISIFLSCAVAFLILGPRPEGMEGIVNVSFLPTINAVLNSITTLLLIIAYVLIKQKKIQLHKKTMLAAFSTSTLFLITYVIYHWFKSGPTEYTGGWQSFYFFILFTHIVLAMIILPLAMTTLYRGWTMNISKHKKIAKITLPIWLYVSVTGVIVYIMLYL